jgi:two-component system sensor histidine kinase TctE
MPRARTLRRQLIAWLTLPLITLWGISTWVDYDISTRFTNLAYDRALLEAALDIGRNIKMLDDRIYVDLPDAALQMLQTRESGRLYYLVTGPAGELITGNEYELPPPPDLGTDRVRYYNSRLRDRPIRAVVLRQPVQPGSGRGVVFIHVAERLTVRSESARQIILRMVLPQGLLVLIAALAVWYGVGRGLRPLGDLQAELERRSHRDLSPLPEREAPGEVQPLIRAMNDLLARLDIALQAQQRFIADAAHQLRTPLAGIKTQTELALRQPQQGETQAMLTQLQAATEQTTRLANQLLALARAEPAGRREHATEPLDIAKLARETTADWVPRALARGIDLGFEEPGNGVLVQGNAFLLREMLNNLLDNAVRYTRSDGHITVRVSAEDDGIVLTVEDDGPGIPEDERERVFERFYRVLGTGAEGCGLGLAIVREIAIGHGAQITLLPGAQGRGTIARVVFPKAA